MKELHSLEMEIPAIIFGNTYLTVPGGNERFDHRELIKLIETIGSRYGTVSGSNLKKGIHYIQKQTHAPSKRQIKMMLRNVRNCILADQYDTSYVYRCSIENYTKIYEFIIKTASEINPDFPSKSDHLIMPTKKGLRYVEANGITDSQKNTATHILKDIEMIDK